MSNKMHIDAELKPYGLPRLLDAIDNLNATMEYRRWKKQSTTGEVLKAAGKEIRGFVGIRQVKTSDGYVWFWGMVFRRKGKQIVVAFPWAQDWQREDNSAADRSIAVYARSSVSDEVISELLEDLWVAL